MPLLFSFRNPMETDENGAFDLILVQEALFNILKIHLAERGELYEYGATDFGLSERNRGKSKADTRNGVG